MSVAKSLAGYLVSSFFVLSLYLAISSFTIGNLIQKDNIKSFVDSQITESMASQTCEKYCSSDVNQERCEEYCSNLDVELRQMCKETCLSNISQSEAKEACMNTCLSELVNNESKKAIYETIDEVYRKKFIDNISLDDILPIFKNTILLIVLSLIFGFSIFLVSDKPVSKIGNDVIWVSVSMLAITAVPIFIISPDMPIMKVVSDYVLEGLYTQITLGAILLAVGIVLKVIGKKIRK